MRLSYDPKHNIAYIRLKQKAGETQTIHVSDQLNVDLAPDGTVYGIELMNARAQLGEGEPSLVVVNEVSRKETRLPLEM